MPTFQTSFQLELLLVVQHVIKHVIKQAIFHLHMQVTYMYDANLVLNFSVNCDCTLFGLKRTTVSCYSAPVTNSICQCKRVTL